MHVTFPNSEPICQTNQLSELSVERFDKRQKSNFHSSSFTVQGEERSYKYLQSQPNVTAEEVEGIEKMEIGKMRG